MGAEMVEIVRLRLQEAVRMDLGRLEALFDELGICEAEAVTGRALGEIAKRIEQMRAARARVDQVAFAGLARSLARVATQIGLTSLARVARDAGTCATGGDAVAFAATWARLDRIAVRALSTVWDAQDISV
jgi:hypothetical protein